MRCILIGSKQLSVNVFRILQKHQVEIAGVFSRDSETGMRIWHEDLGHESLFEIATQQNIPVFDGYKINSEKTKELISYFHADIIFSCFWGEIFDAEILSITPMGAFNLHTAYLPKYRGSRPIPWAIINNEEYCGLTIHKMAMGVDNGEIVSQVKVPIEKNETCKEVYDNVISAGSELFDLTLPTFIDQTFTLTKQDENQATYYPRGEPFGRQLMPHWSSDKANLLKRAFDFPPFQPVTQPPKILARKPELYFVESSTAPSLSENLEAEFNLDLFEQSMAYRKTVRPIIKMLSPRGIKLNLSHESLAKGYKLLDALRSADVAFVLTNGLTPNLDPKRYQPLRHVNGVLEIPTISAEKKEDLQRLRSEAQSLVANSGKDVFLATTPLQEQASVNIHKLVQHFNQRD